MERTGLKAPVNRDEITNMNIPNTVTTIGQRPVLTLTTWIFKKYKM